MKQYEKYKPSGYEWIGEIPSHWETKKMRFIGNFTSSGIDKKIIEGEPLVKIVNYTDVYGNENRILNSERVYMEVSCPEERRNEHQVKKGDLIFTPSSETIEDIGLSALVDEELENTAYSYHVLRFRFEQNVDHNFKKYLCNNHFVLNQFSSNARGTTRQILNRENFNSVTVVLPKIEEQSAIANFLDEKIEQIDKLISNKQKLIDLLKEERTVIINEAVNGKGKHWESKKLKYVIKDFESGVSVNAEDEQVDSIEVVGVLKTSCVYNYVFESNENKRVLKEEISRVSCPVKANSIIMSRMNTPELVGASGFVEKDYPNLFLPDRLWQTVLFKNVQLNVKWLSYLFISNSFRQEMTSKATGTSSSMKNLSKSDVLDIKLALPSPKEQTAIVQHIQTETERIDDTISKIKKEIELMQEYRMALISEVVTGKMKMA